VSFDVGRSLPVFSFHVLEMCEYNVSMHDSGADLLLQIVIVFICVDTDVCMCVCN